MSDNDTIVIPIPSGSGGSIPIPSKSLAPDFIDKIKPEMMVEAIRHRLLGEEWNGQKWEKIMALKEVALTEVGAWEISNMMLSAGSINISISNLSKQQIASRLRNLLKEVLAKMLASWKSYGIHSLGQFWYVKSIVFSNALGVLSQAGDGSIQELFKTSIHENRQITTEKKPSGKLRRLLGMGEK